MTSERTLMRQQKVARRQVEIHFENLDRTRTYKCVGLTEEFDHATVQAAGEKGLEVIQCTIVWTDGLHRLISSLKVRDSGASGNSDTGQ